MSQYVQGNISQTVNSDYGQFINIGPLRVRKDLIQMYRPHYNSEKKEVDGIVIFIGNGWVFIDFEPTQCDIELKKLDWIYKKGNPQNE